MHVGVTKRQGAYLPHWRSPGAVYAVVFRLADSVPQAALQQWQRIRDDIVATARTMGRHLTEIERQRLSELRRRLDLTLDEGFGACHLRHERFASLVRDTMHHFDGERFLLCAWCIMPNHVHAVVCPAGSLDLSRVLQSWKGYTGKKACEMLGCPGPFWQKESYDHLVRDRADFVNQVRYVLDNPTKAGLVAWPWSGRNRDNCEAAIAHLA